jgi:hypothetical protein
MHCRLLTCALTVFFAPSCLFRQVNNVPINVSSQAIRADILHYIVYHDANEQKELPPEVQRLRHTER